VGFLVLQPGFKFLLVAGVLLGYNGLITIRGPKSGVPGTTLNNPIEPAEWRREPLGVTKGSCNLDLKEGCVIRG
jgi:hypothetical protein